MLRRGRLTTSGRATTAKSAWAWPGWRTTADWCRSGATGGRDDDNGHRQAAGSSDQGGRREAICAGLFVRILAANHSSRHPALRNGRCPGVAPDASRFSLGFLQSLRSCEIHRRSARHSKYEDIPLDRITRMRDSRVLYKVLPMRALSLTLRGSNGARHA